MLTPEELDKSFEQSALEVIPTKRKRIVIPCQGFEGAKPCTYNYKGEQKTDDGLAFFNPKDKTTQVLKQANGCLIMYDGPGRKEKVQKYLDEHPDAVKTADGIKELISYLKENVVNSEGEPDIWDTNTKFASNLKDAPALEDIKPGQMIVSVKKEDAAKAIFVNEGVEFQGTATATPQVAGKGGAYIIKEETKEGGVSLRMIQADEFRKTYEITKEIAERPSSGMGKFAQAATTMKEATPPPPKCPPVMAPKYPPIIGKGGNSM